MKNLKFRTWDGDRFYYSSCAVPQFTDLRKWIKEHNHINQQFTDFLDCDLREIYEGDILQWEENRSWEEGGGTIIGIYIVQWDEERGQWMLYDPFDSSHWEMYKTQYENIVGNIFENKSLLPCEDEVE